MSFAANPRADQPDPSSAPREAAGPVTADSLAAESLRGSGGFAENENAHALGVKGGQSTLNTTDTSGATALHAAPSGAVREQQDARAAGPDEKGPTGLKLDALGQPEFGGKHSLQGYAGGPSGPSAGMGVRPHVDAAPVYTGVVTGAALSEGTFKPKGDNLEDAGATNSMPQTRTFTGDVGGVHDPGRLAERAFEGRNTDPNPELRHGGDNAGTQRAATAEDRGGQYDVLGSERA
ncbi:uncharacterized protein A1O9_08938 [Exophiala aquamarina CBS 119918]|uniref:Uncharacterized protein n=1 Tax=Exophiala aquamarina CBS 119918 TaxID=1182545 RepID=A0A072P5D8_9EURO|nr:uncharacterized protein A1O9_08938 [Exophiala aquamarina CBS 119918]KEF55284.1 hypothetical protein A1O9_08938 [Exophiala aquamarina CBS 119918]